MVMMMMMSNKLVIFLLICFIFVSNHIQQSHQKEEHFFEMTNAYPSLMLNEMKGNELHSIENLAPQHHPDMTLNLIRNEIYPNCSNLYSTQYTCIVPNIDPNTYEYQGCRSDHTVEVQCSVLDGVICHGPKVFSKTIPCHYTNQRHFSTTLGLSIFVGLSGFDRFYLGYVGVGLLKLFTFCFFGVGYWTDIVLIALQRLQPADGSTYVVGYHGPRTSKLFADDQETAYVY